MFDIFIKPGNKVIESKLIFYSPEKNQQTFQLLFNEELICNLPPGSWFETGLPSSTKTIKVRLISEDGKTFEETVIPRLFHKDIYICYERKKKPPFFRKLTSQAAESTMQDLVPANQVK